MRLPRTLGLLVTLGVTAGCPPPHDKPGESASATFSDTGCNEPWCASADDTADDDDDDNDDRTSADDDDDDSAADDDDDDDDDDSTVQDECEASADCTPGFCVAPFNPALGVFGKGAFACVTECVDLLDELKWCADQAACCDPRAECTDRGYCELLDDGGSDGTAGSGDESGGDTTAAEDTGADDTAGATAGGTQ